MIDGGVFLTYARAELLRTGRSLAYGGLSGLKHIMEADENLVHGDLEDFRRAGEPVRMAQLGALLAASDVAGWQPNATGIIAWNGCGCAAANRAYWDDYVKNGHDMGRSSLFVPTLPSIPACEAAIALAANGPVLYVKNDAPGALQHMVEDMFASEPDLRQMLLMEIDTCEACVLCISQGGTLPAANSLKEIFMHAKGESLP